jgi:AraC-like DNA-binding protein
MSDTIDPLAEMVALLQPRTLAAKCVSGAGPWRLRRTIEGQPFFAAVLEGALYLTVDGMDALTLTAGDFVLIPAAYGFTTSSTLPLTDATPDTAISRIEGGVRLGHQDGPADMRMLVGHCQFGSPDAGLLVSLLPRLVLVRGEARLATLVRLVGEEARASRPARDMVVSRLLEVLLIEALRSAHGPAVSPGLLRGLGDDRLAVAIRQMHANPTAPWTVAQLAKAAALSRSTFFARFTEAVGLAPMEYLLGWRMALGKAMLRRREGSVAEVARRVGYGSASAFSVAFTRHVGMPPTLYARHETPVLNDS